MNRSFCFAFLRSRLLAWSSWNTEEFNFWTLKYYWGETSEILLFVLVTIRSERRVFLGSSHTSHKVELKKEDWPFFFICVESKDNLISSLHFGKPEKGESWVISNQTNVVLEVNHPASEQSWWPVLFPGESDSNALYCVWVIGPILSEVIPLYTLVKRVNCCVVYSYTNAQTEGVN